MCVRHVGVHGSYRYRLSCWREVTLDLPTLCALMAMPIVDAAQRLAGGRRCLPIHCAPSTYTVDLACCQVARTYSYSLPTHVRRLNQCSAPPAASTASHTASRSAPGYLPSPPTVDELLLHARMCLVRRAALHDKTITMVERFHVHTHASSAKPWLPPRYLDTSGSLHDRTRWERVIAMGRGRETHDDHANGCRQSRLARQSNGSTVGRVERTRPKLL